MPQKQYVHRPSLWFALKLALFCAVFSGSYLGPSGLLHQMEARHTHPAAIYLIVEKGSVFGCAYRQGHHLHRVTSSVAAIALTSVVSRASTNGLLSQQTNPPFSSASSASCVPAPTLTVISSHAIMHMANHPSIQLNKPA